MITVAEEITPNVCQYWSIDKDGNPIEPGKCPFWDIASAVCTFKETDAEGNVVRDDQANVIRASYYPHCNLIGTQHLCNQYAGTGVQKRCILPDPARHVVNRGTGEKWVLSSTLDEKGIVTKPADYSLITEYNDGGCDGAGTATKCDAYSPYHLGFSAIQPDDSLGTLGYDETEMSVLSGTRLPLDYEVYNLRPVLSRCYWWQTDPIEFTVDRSTGLVERIEFLCQATNIDEMVLNYSDFKWDNELKMYRGPCNGAKPECPRYTGVCWQYCIDEKTRKGDKVLAEQILELRYHIKKDTWEIEDYEKSFKEPDIHAWEGGITYQATNQFGDTNYEIPARRTYISDFDVFEIDYQEALLTKGMASKDDYKKDYPDLVRELKDPTLTPLIRNKFDQVGDDNVFETGDIEHKYVLIFGDIFWYNAETYAINLDDPDLKFLPPQLKLFDSMSEIEQAFLKDTNNPDGFTNFHAKLDTILTFMLSAMPDKINTSEFGKDSNMFYINAATKFGDNTICVLNKTTGRWEFSKISFEKIYIGGIVAQQSFTLTGESVIDYLPAYDSSFAADLNSNGSISFTYAPLSASARPSLAYVYLDGVRKRLPVTPTDLGPDTYELTYRLYKVTVGEDLVLLLDSVRFFGNAGYALVILPDEDKILSNVIKDWDIDGKLKLHYPDGTWIEMEMYEKCTDRLEINQLIIRPKDINKFTAACPGAYVTIEKLFTWERRSAGQTPSQSYVEERESFTGETDNIDYREGALSIDVSGVYGAITGFGNEPLMVSVVARGASGRIKAHVKTKMITWVRQPYCRDVEINYNWSAIYKYYKVLPEFNCYGPGGVSDERTVQRGYTPPCGDHDLSLNTGIGPMWYPYDDCDSSARYNISGYLTEWDIRIMEPFWEGAYDPPKGSHDIRMMGPADNFAKTCGTHAHLWNCLCDWSFCNSEKTSENLFTGYGRYRGGLSYLDKLKCLRGEGSLPKFGNTYRDFLRSYRSMDNVDYYVLSNNRYVRKRKWVPINEFYTTASLTASAYDYPYLLYCSNDYYADNSTFMHPLGFMTIDGKIEGITINEEIVTDEETGLPTRYEFDDIFRTHSSLAGLYYPYPKDPFFRVIGGLPVPIITWFTYKDPPGGSDSSKSVQWAWQEYWKEIERYSEEASVVATLIANESYTYIGLHKTLSEIFEEQVVATYTEGGNSSATGRHRFLGVEYPEHKYDYMLKEHRLVCGEGDHTLKIVAPAETEEDTGFYDSDSIWSVQLDSGSKRCFDLNGAWVDGDGCNKDLYDTCTSSPWVEDVTLFDDVYTTTPDADRTIDTYDSLGDPEEAYYHRGLAVTLDTTKFEHLPRKIVRSEYENYELKLSKLADGMDEGSGGEWATLEDLDEFYPATNVLDLTYLDSPAGLDIVVKFNGALSVAAVAIEFDFGAVEGTDDPPKLQEPEGLPLIFMGELYNVPGVQIYRSSDGSSYSRIYNMDNMVLAGKKDTLTHHLCFYEIDFTTDHIKNPYEYIKISFRFEPTQAEIDARGDLNQYYGTEPVISKTHIKSLYLYHNKFIDATEDITTYERKYNISTGNHGDFPPHGTDATGSLLYPVYNDGSTVYQYDTINGMVGVPNSAGRFKTMNKCRGRIVFETHPDKEPLSMGAGGGLGWLRDAEKEQKKIYDAIAVEEGGEEFTCTSMVPPGLNEKLNPLGMMFPSWLCSFHNSVVRPLKVIEAQSTYSPCGHKFVRDWPNAHHETACGSHGSVFGRSQQEVVYYVFIHECTGDLGWEPMDALVAYTRGIARVLTNPMAYIGAELSHNEEMSNRISASQLSDPVVLRFMQTAGSLT